ncbi:MAG: DUF2341 domain-containing protein [Bacteroidetes bacterium]|nr:DUF2341 domain-containing protein [Bacteroidota bacterium]
MTIHSIYNLGKSSLLFIAYLLLALLKVQAQAPIGYTYVRPIVISNTNIVPLSNFQITFDLQTSTLVSANKMKANANDILFQHGCKNLCFWIEDSSFNNIRTTFWVKVDTITPGIDTIYMYYGNAGAALNPYYDGDCTFEFFDDFNAGAVNTTKWPTTDQALFGIGSAINITSPISTSGHFTISATSGNNHRIGLVHQMTMSNYEVGSKFKINFHPYTNGAPPDADIEIGWCPYPIVSPKNVGYSPGLSRIATYLMDDEFPNEYCGTNTAPLSPATQIGSSILSNDLRGDWNYARVRTLNNTLEARRFTYSPFFTTNKTNDIFNTSIITYTNNTSCLFVGSSAYGDLPFAVDFIFVKKAVANEPTATPSTERLNALPCLLSIISNSPVCNLQALTFTLNSGCTQQQPNTYLITGPNGLNSSITSSTYTISNSTFTNSGKYYTIDTVLQCPYIDSTVVSILPLPTIISTSVSVCNGNSVVVSANGAISYSWSNGLTGAAINYIPTSSETLTVTGTDINGCSNDTTAFITVNSNPQTNFSLAIGDSICAFMGKAIAQIEPGNTIFWFLDNLPIGIDTSATLNLQAVGSYTLKLIEIDSFGCADTLEKTVNVIEDFASTIYIPNCFTPNNDGVNDTWGIEYTCLKDMKCEIFNRWGEHIKTLKSLDERWDGYYKGRLVDCEVFVYKIIATDKLNEAKLLRIGHVTVLR